MTLRMTGPDIQVEQGLSGGSAAAWDLSISAAASGDATSAVLKLGARYALQSDWEPVETPESTADIAGATVTVSLDTVDLDLPEYLWEVSLFNSDGELVQRWRGMLFVSSSLP